MDIVRDFAWEHDVTMHFPDLSLPLLELVCKLSRLHLHLGHRPGYRLSWPHLWLNIYLGRRAFIVFYRSGRGIIVYSSFAEQPLWCSQLGFVRQEADQILDSDATPQKRGVCPDRS
jgi:hypothetical protein